MLLGRRAGGVGLCVTCLSQLIAGRGPQAWVSVCGGVSAVGQPRSRNTPKAARGAAGPAPPCTFSMIFCSQEKSGKEDGAMKPLSVRTGPVPSRGAGQQNANAYSDQLWLHTCGQGPGWTQNQPRKVVWAPVRGPVALGPPPMVMSAVGAS